MNYADDPQATPASEHTQTITIVNKLGLHARAAAKVAELASQFTANQTVLSDGQSADCKSIISLLMLAAGQGSQVTIKASGPDAAKACQALCALITDRFGERE